MRRTTVPADELVQELLDSDPGLSLRRLPVVLGQAWASAYKQGRAGTVTPPRWQRTDGSEPLGYVALYQRILNYELPANGKVAREYEEPLRVALAEILQRDIPRLEFKAASSQGVNTIATARRPARALWDLLAEKERSGSLDRHTYTLLAHDFNLGTPRSWSVESGGDWRAALTEGELLELDLEPKDDRVREELEFARFSRLLASGLRRGVRLEILLSPSLQSLASGPRSTSLLEQRGELEGLARFRLGLLISLGDTRYARRPFLQLRHQPLLDAAARTHLARAERAYREDPLDASNHLPEAARRAAENLTVIVLPTAPPTNDLALEMLRGLPLRILLETTRVGGGAGHHVNGYVWLRLQSDGTGDVEARLSSEGLLALDQRTSQHLHDLMQVHSAALS